MFPSFLGTNTKSKRSNTNSIIADSNRFIACVQLYIRGIAPTTGRSRRGWIKQIQLTIQAKKCGDRPQI